MAIPNMHQNHQMHQNNHMHQNHQICQNHQIQISTLPVHSIFIFSVFIAKGSLPIPKRMNFWKSSKRPLTPPLLIFGKLCCRFFKTYPENTPFVSFLCQKNPVQKSKICNKNFWIGNDPPPVWNFSKNSSVLVG